MKEKKFEAEEGKITGFFDKNTEIKGDLKFSGSFQIDGQFNGTIDSKAILIVGENGKVEADVKIGIIIINGEIRGKIHALQKVEINSKGKLYGTVTTPNLVVREGAHLEATCHTTDKEVIPEEKEEEKEEKKESEQKDSGIREGFLT